MPLDPNIPLQVQAPQIQNPLDAAAKAMSMSYFLQNAKRAQLENQMQKIQLGNQVALNQALAKNTSVDSNGNVSINHAGVMNDLIGQGRGYQVPQATKALNQYDLGTMSAHNQMFGALLQSIPTGANVPLAQKQSAYASAVAKGHANGLPGMENLPDQYPGDNVINQLRVANSNVSDFLKAQSNQIAQQGVDVKRQDLALQREKFTQGKQQDALNKTMTLLNSGRQTPDVRQAYLDRYNGQKIIDLINTKLNNPEMVTLTAGEVAKVAQGGVPQEEELKNITPSDAKMIIARTQEWMGSHPKDSQQDAFLHVFKTYATTIQNNANQLIKKRVGSVIETEKPWLSSTDYTNLNKNYVEGTPGDILQPPPNGGNGGMMPAQNAPGAQPPQASSGAVPPQASNDYPIGTMAKTKSGVPVIYKGNGVWQPQ